MLDDLRAGRRVASREIGPTFTQFFCQDAMTNTTPASRSSTIPMAMAGEWTWAVRPFPAGAALVDWFCVERADSR
jgi:hypothetical protein